MNYYDVLGRIHQEFLPRTYLEIGTRHGESMRLAQPGTKAIGIDPAPSITHDLSHLDLMIAQMTSDDYFSNTDHVSHELDSSPIDFAFIDGMHHSEYVLRDFANIQRFCNNGSVIAIHDVLPINERSASREQNTFLWSGDVWKAVVALHNAFPNLEVVTIDVAPSGLTLITNLNPLSPISESDVASVITEMESVTWSGSMGSERKRILNVESCRWPTIRSVFSSAPWRPVAANPALKSTWRRQVAAEVVLKHLRPPFRSFREHQYSHAVRGQDR